MYYSHIFNLNMDKWVLEMGHNGVISSYTISTSIPRVDGRSMDHRILGCHTSSYSQPIHEYGTILDIDNTRDLRKTIENWE